MPAKSSTFYSLAVRHYVFVLPPLILLLRFATRKQDIFSPPPLSLGSWQCNISVFTILAALFVLLLILYFFVPLLSPKIKISPQGIYILHANRLFTWDEISGASHVVIPKWQLAGDENWFDWEKTLIIHRYQQASVAIPDISIFSLWACKKYSPGLKTNLLTQGIASIIYSAWWLPFLYFLYTADWNLILSINMLNVIGLVCIVGIFYWLILPYSICIMENKRWHIRIPCQRQAEHTAYYLISKQ